MNLQTVNLNTRIEHPKLAELTSLSTGQCFYIESVLRLGRAPENEIKLSDPHVSQYHCQIEKRPRGIFLRDLGSTNGTWLDNYRINEVELIHGGSFRIGSHEFLFKYADKQVTFTQPTMTSKNLSWNTQLATLSGISKMDLPILLQGESGTGKDILAQHIHSISLRSKEPFIAVNCSTLSENLIESELFGHFKGSFTGAMTDRKGAFESARGGTIFLDEIGDLPLNLQPKLLRALENNEIRPVGSDRAVKTDVRIIAASHKDLKTLVKNNQFRSDLYYRLNVVQFKVPGLRNRIEDFEDLLYHFARHYKVRFSHATVLEMKRHTWPGNIRELKNTVARAKAKFEDRLILPSHLFSIIDFPASGPDDQSKGSSGRFYHVRDLEKGLILERLQFHNFNQRRTAMELGVPKSTLHDKIKAFNIDINSLRNLK